MSDLCWRPNRIDALFGLAAAVLAASAVTVSLARAAEAKLAVRSPAFTNNTAIPVDYTCDGKGQSPPIAWSNLPATTKSVAIVIDDPDAPHRTFVHWVVYNLPSNLNHVPANASRDGLPSGATQGLNGKHEAAYTPMCPPSGVHHYHVKVYALNSAVSAARPLTEDTLDRLIKGHIVAEGELVGRYEAQKK